MLPRARGMEVRVSVRSRGRRRGEDRVRAARSEGARGHWWAEDIVAAPRRFPLGSSLPAAVVPPPRDRPGRQQKDHAASSTRHADHTTPIGLVVQAPCGLVFPLVCLFFDSWAGGAPRLTSGGRPAQFLMFSLSRIFEETEIVNRFFCSNGNGHGNPKKPLYSNLLWNWENSCCAMLCRRAVNGTI